MTFVPRLFQDELGKVIQERASSREKFTVANCGPGTGKTFGALLAADSLVARGLISAVAWYTPRLSLCHQGELEWNDLRKKIPAHLGDVNHTENDVILRKEESFSFITTYSSLSSFPEASLMWAERHKDDFLLICDEAQFLGEETVAKRHMQRMSDLAVHALIMTGTPDRSDGEEVFGCTYSDPDEKGFRRLQSHVSASYTACVAEGFLRPFQANVMEGSAVWNEFSGTSTVMSLAELDEKLSWILQEDGIWIPIVDGVVSRLRLMQDIDIYYRGLIACARQDHARKVVAYLKQNGVKAVIAVSDDGEAAYRTLRSFRQKGGAEILVTVGMAHIGYDCPEITVIGDLNPARTDSFLEQLCGRAWRVRGDLPLDSQTCFLVVPGDPAMKKFVERMKSESIAGIRLRKETPPGSPPPPQEINGFFDQGQITGEHIIGLHGDVAPQELTAVRKLQKDFGLGGAPEAGLLAAIHSAGGKLVFNYSSEQGKNVVVEASPNKTHKEMITEVVKSARANIAAAVHNQDKSEYMQEYQQNVTREVNRRLNIKSAKHMDRGQVPKYLPTVSEVLRDKGLV